MPDHPAQRAAIPLAFFAGILVTIFARDIVLARRRKQQSHLDDDNDNNDDAADVQQDPRSGPPPIVNGIEGTIGNTHLVRIKSLSDATGCEILAKAEMLNGAGNSPKDRVALSLITTVCPGLGGVLRFLMMHADNRCSFCQGRTRRTSTPVLRRCDI